MSTQNTSASIDLNRQLLYYTIRLQNSDDTLHAWMRHILAYLTSTMEELQPAYAQLQQRPQETHLIQYESWDGSCDCPRNSWVRELSYEQHCRKLLMSRVNVGDTNSSSSIDEDSLRREASLVMESVNRSANEGSTSESEEDDEDGQIIAVQPMGMDGGLFSSSASSDSSDWDFVIYDSDNDNDDEEEEEEEDTDADSFNDPTYKVCASDLLKLGSEYSSDEEYDDDLDADIEEIDFDRVEKLQQQAQAQEQEQQEEVAHAHQEIQKLSNYTYDVCISTSLHLSGTNSTEKRTVKLAHQHNVNNGNKTAASCTACCHCHHPLDEIRSVNLAENPGEFLYFDSLDNDDEAVAEEEHFENKWQQ